MSVIHLFIEMSTDIASIKIGYVGMHVCSFNIPLQDLIRTLSPNRHSKSAAGGYSGPEIIAVTQMHIVVRILVDILAMQQ